MGEFLITVQFYGQKSETTTQFLVKWNGQMVIVKLNQGILRKSRKNHVRYLTTSPEIRWSFANMWDILVNILTVCVSRPFLSNRL